MSFPSKPTEILTVSCLKTSTDLNTGYHKSPANFCPQVKFKDNHHILSLVFIFTLFFPIPEKPPNKCHRQKESAFFLQIRSGKLKNGQLILD